MTGMVKNITGAPSASSLTWKTIDWNHVTTEVKRLQMRIAKAVRLDGRVMYTWPLKGLSRVR
jgi:hypothetical protein